MHKYEMTNHNTCIAWSMVQSGRVVSEIWLQRDRQTHTYMLITILHFPTVGKVIIYSQMAWLHTGRRRWLANQSARVYIWGRFDWQVFRPCSSVLTVPARQTHDIAASRSDPASPGTHPPCPLIGRQSTPALQWPRPQHMHRPITTLSWSSQSHLISSLPTSSQLTKYQVFFKLTITYLRRTKHTAVYHRALDCYYGHEIMPEIFWPCW